MSADMQAGLRAFATRVLEQGGGLIEWSPSNDAGVAVVDQRTADLLGNDDELVPLTFQPAASGLWINLAGDFLERMGRLLDSQPRVAKLRMREGYLKRRGLDDAIRNSFTWLNAKVTVNEESPREMEYHTWWLHAGIVSEDRWDARLPVTINSLTGAEVPLPDPASMWDIEADLNESAPPTMSLAIAAQMARQRVLQIAAQFITRMEARLNRDRKRLNDYYGALLREATHPKTRHNAAPDPEKMEAKKRAVQLELRRKLNELDERYALRVTLRPLVLVQTTMTVVAVPLVVLRKQARRVHVVYWNPVIKGFEPLVCGQCQRGTFSVAFTNDTVEPRCAACMRH